ncbi:MAG: glycosyltransferase family 2 protein [Candidatus Omnitrophica bacterium]|nr:glycosyltransferase family 2 protein [Candidatus Omnitrophota bacterium]
MSVPRVSVIVAVHNGQRHLEASLACVLRQTFSDFELMVVDDGSTDRTPEILSRLSDEDSRLRVIQQEHRGQTASLIRAMRVAQGAYLARQDADDLSHPERFERQLRYFDAHPSVGALGCATEIIDEEGRVLGVMPMRHGIARVRRGLMTLKATMVHSSIMMRRQTYEAVGRYREVFCVSQDTDLWLRMVQRYDVDNLPERLVQWRVSRDGVYTSQREKQLKYGGVALAFAHERARFGEDSYDLLARVGGDLEAFAARYRLSGMLHAIWGELLFRGLRDPAAARPYFARALAQGFVRPKTACFFGWSLMGLAWPGGAPFSVRPGQGQT